jgi:hypothetical protein
MNGNQLLMAKVDSCNSPLSFDRQFTAAAGDTVDFILDWGADHSPIGDGTGLGATIAAVD